MPDRKIDLFIQGCLQNNGRLSAKKRAGDFQFLSDTEVARMEEVIRIHLATALHIRDTAGIDVFLTHDAQLASAASASGFAVEGV